IEPRPGHGSWAPLAGDLQYSRDSAGRFDPAHVFVQIIASFLTEARQLPQRAVEQRHNSARFLPVVTGHPTSWIVMPADTVRVNESPLVFARESQRESQLTAMDFRFVITRSRVVDVSRWRTMPIGFRSVHRERPKRREGYGHEIIERPVGAQEV